MSNKFKAKFTVCDSCDAHYEHRASNQFHPGHFNFCPNCGEELPNNNPREKEHEIGWIPPQRQRNE